MTSRERSVHVAISDFIAMHGYSPTLRELAALVGLRSTSTIKEHVDALARQGLISWNPKQQRTIRLLQRDAGDVGEEAS